MTLDFVVTYKYVGGNYRYFRWYIMCSTGLMFFVISIGPLHTLLELTLRNSRISKDLVQPHQNTASLIMYILDHIKVLHASLIMYILDHIKVLHASLIMYILDHIIEDQRANVSSINLHNL